MTAEPLQHVMRLLLEADGYFVRSNVRFEMKYAKAKGKAGAYSDLDIIAVKIDPATGLVTDRVWAEVKAHLTSTFTRGYVLGFIDDYATLLGDKAFGNATFVKRFGAEKTAKLRHKCDAAVAAARAALGTTFRRRLYFGGSKAASAASAPDVLDPAVEVVYIADELPRWIKRVSHQEGNEDMARLVSAMRAYGMLRVDVID